MNSLYLFCMGQPQPTGNFIRYVKNTDGTFSSHMRDYYGHMALEWLNWEATSQGVYIKHKFNGGEEIIKHDNRTVRLDGLVFLRVVIVQLSSFTGATSMGVSDATRLKRIEDLIKNWKSLLMNQLTKQQNVKILSKMFSKISFSGNNHFGMSNFPNVVKTFPIG